MTQRRNRATQTTAQSQPTQVEELEQREVNDEITLIGDFEGVNIISNEGLIPLSKGETFKILSFKKELTDGGKPWVKFMSNKGGFLSTSMLTKSRIDVEDGRIISPKGNFSIYLKRFNDLFSNDWELLKKLLTNVVFTVKEVETYKKDYTVNTLSKFFHIDMENFDDKMKELDEI